MYSPSTLDGVGNFSVHATKKKKILQLQLKEKKNLLRRDERKSMKENCSFRVLMPGKCLYGTIKLAYRDRDSKTTLMC